ncbi:MAG: hypothetical protein LBJ00_00385 [Planctomycetaceae bacterium]|nr:hypothetical protein [Planctomycetaceae bacterium]
MKRLFKGEVHRLTGFGISGFLISPTQRKNFTSTSEHQQNFDSYLPNVNYGEKIHQLF